MPYEFARLGVSPLEFGFWLSFTGIGYFLGNILIEIMRLNMELKL